MSSSETERQISEMIGKGKLERTREGNYNRLKQIQSVNKKLNGFWIEKSMRKTMVGSDGKSHSKKMRTSYPKNSESLKRKKKKINPRFVADISS